MPNQKRSKKKDFFALSYTNITAQGKKKQVVFDYEDDHKKALRSARTHDNTRITDVLGNAVVYDHSGAIFARNYTGIDHGSHTRHYSDN